MADLKCIGVPVITSSVIIYLHSLSELNLCVNTELGTLHSIITLQTNSACYSNELYFNISRGESRLILSKIVAAAFQSAHEMFHMP